MPSQWNRPGGSKNNLQERVKLVTLKKFLGVIKSPDKYYWVFPSSLLHTVLFALEEKKKSTSPLFQKIYILVGEAQ